MPKMQARIANKARSNLDSLRDFKQNAGDRQLHFKFIEKKQ